MCIKYEWSSFVWVLHHSMLSVLSLGQQSTGMVPGSCVTIRIFLCHVCYPDA